MLGFVVAVSIGVCAAPAGAALYLVFRTHSDREPGTNQDHTRGISAPGQTVLARTGEHEAMGREDSMPVFLVSVRDYADVSKKVDSARVLERDDTLTDIGALRADRKRNGHLQFVVPDLPFGNYEIVAYCPSCARFSFGRNVQPLAAFVIARPSRLPPTGFPLACWSLVGLSLAMAGMSTLRCRQERSS
jgi:hypothetical protein